MTPPRNYTPRINQCGEPTLSCRVCRGDGKFSIRREEDTMGKVMDVCYHSINQLYTASETISL